MVNRKVDRSWGKMSLGYVRVRRRRNNILPAGFVMKYHSREQSPGTTAADDPYIWLTPGQEVTCVDIGVATDVPLRCISGHEQNKWEKTYACASFCQLRQALSLAVEPREVEQVR